MIMIEQRAKVNNNNNNIMQALIQLPTKANNGHEVAQGMANTPLSLSAYSQPQTQSQLQFRGGNSAQHLKLMEIYSQTTHTHIDIICKLASRWMEKLKCEMEPINREARRRPPNTRNLSEGNRERPPD